jgi:hypothetical protein
MMDYEGALPEGITDLGDGNYLVQGIEPDSDWEVMYCIALSNAGWDYKFQLLYWINGDSLSIDIYLFTIPRETFIFIDGKKWHGGNDAQQDEIERLQLSVHAKKPIVVVLNEDCSTYDACWAHVTRTFGRR